MGPMIRLSQLDARGLLKSLLGLGRVPQSEIQFGQVGTASTRTRASIGVLGEATHEQPATSCIVAPRVSESSRVVDHPLQPGRWGGVAGFALTASTEMRGAPEGVGRGGRRVGEEGWASRRTGKETVQGTRRGLANQNDDATSQPLGLRERMRS